MILVSDTSTIFDLQRSDFLEVIFTLPHVFAVPDVLYHRELTGAWGARLVALGLRVEGISEGGVRNALEYRRRCMKLSIADSFALALAKERAWSLLSGDNYLRVLADAEEVKCHSVLWLLDPMDRKCGVSSRG